MNYEQVLSSWLELNNTLRNATEKECEELMHFERGHRNRIRMMLRIHGRFNILRAARERIEIMRKGN
jgi:hypothetical protein